MDSSRFTDLVRLLRQRLSRFLANGSRARAPLFATLDHICSRNDRAFLFGGVLRDLMMRGPSAFPRDIDIVVCTTNRMDFDRQFGDLGSATNRFGGVRFSANGWAFDIWPLEETWAFRNSLVSCRGFHDLPATTFLNIEAVVAELKPRPGRARLVHSRGFFEAVLSRTLDINLEENPFPDSCVVRSLVLSAKYRFHIAPRLVRYIVKQGMRIAPEQFDVLQLRHYGRVFWLGHEIEAWIRTLAKHLQLHPNDPARSPIEVERQPLLFEHSHI